MTPSVIVPSTSRKSTWIGFRSGAAATRCLLDGLVHAHGLVEERRPLRERPLRRRVGQRPLGLRVRLEEQAVDAAGDCGAHERKREAAIAAGLYARPLHILWMRPPPLQA